jgi:cell division septum initiation protein DivIVA
VVSKGYDAEEVKHLLNKVSKRLLAIIRKNSGQILKIL